MVGRLVVAAGVFLAIAVRPILAQGTPPAGIDSASILLLKPDRFVRIQLPDLGRIQGTVGLRTESELVLRLEGEDRRVSLAAVDTLWVRGRHTKTGAIIGGLLGIGGGIFLGALVNAVCEYDCDGNYVVGGAVFGAVTGGVVGAIIGAAIPRWRRVFPE
jgi:hypothetical protein